MLLQYRRAYIKFNIQELTFEWLPTAVYPPRPSDVPRPRRLRDGDARHHIIDCERKCGRRANLNLIRHCATLIATTPVSTPS
jgi:hypothetical protein